MNMKSISVSIRNIYMRNSRFLSNNHKLYVNLREFSVGIAKQQKICVIGAGPAGFYATQHILRALPSAQIDIIEKLPVPFGLVRFGVAPDHPEVKNVINTFTKVAENARVRFIGNLSLGTDVTLAELRNNYNAVILCYGAEQDRKMDVPNEDGNVLSAREFVAWYNGLPGMDLNSVYSQIVDAIRKSSTVSIIGQGNVAIDVARILLSPIEILRKTDITSRALDALASSKIEKVHLIGRRGPLQAAFTIKELREMLKLPEVSTKWRREDFLGVDESLIPNLPRPKKRITELMLKSVQTSTQSSSFGKQFMPIFYRSPKLIEIDESAKRVHLTVNRLSENCLAVATEKTETLATDVILRSIGYKGINVTQPDDGLNFNSNQGLVPNEQGRVLKRKCSTETNAKFDEKYERGLYVSGWLGTGPIGVILTTMNNSFLVADNVCKDLDRGLIDCATKPGLDVTKYNSIVSWRQWQKIDRTEIENGAAIGKPREKFVDIVKMLEAAN